MKETKVLAAVLAALLLVPLGAISAAETSPPAEAGRTVVERLRKGINTDFSPLETNPEKVHYAPAYFDAAKAAGFESVRFFINYTKDPGVYDWLVKDALDRGLVVVLCMWASNTGQEECNESGVHFRDMPRSTSKVSIIDGRSVKGEKTAIWNHDEIVRNNVFVNNTRAQVNFGINGINANRQIPERLQQQNVPGKKAPLDQATRDAAAYQDKSGVPQPAGLSLEKLNFVINGNVYWGGDTVPLMMWGGLLSYQNLKDLRATEGFEKEGVILDPQFADLEKLDLRVPADSPLFKMGCYPRGEVPGVKLGVINN
jgi:hypothetical protein